MNIADDIIVVGRGEASADASRDHDHTFISLLNHLSQHHLKFNPDKIKFKTSNAPFMGHILTPEGLKSSSEIASGSNTSFLRDNHLSSKFCPNLSEVVRPLRNLTHL